MKHRYFRTLTLLSLMLVAVGSNCDAGVFYILRGDGTLQSGFDFNRAYGGRGGYIELYDETNQVGFTGSGPLFTLDAPFEVSDIVDVGNAGANWAWVMANDEFHILRGDGTLQSGFDFSRAYGGDGGYIELYDDTNQIGFSGSGPLFTLDAPFEVSDIVDVGNAGANWAWIMANDEFHILRGDGTLQSGFDFSRAYGGDGGYIELYDDTNQIGFSGSGPLFTLDAPFEVSDIVDVGNAGAGWAWIMVESPNTVPEPSSISIAIAGMLGLTLRRRRRLS